MQEITHDQHQMICLYNAGSRKETISALKEMRPQLQSDETELRELTDSTIAMLDKMADADFYELDLIPDFGGEDDDAD